MGTNARALRHLDWTLLGATLGLTAVGWGMVYSTTAPLGIADRLVMKQVIAGMIGFLGCALLTVVNYQRWSQWVWWLYGGSLLLLGVVLAIGTRSHGTKGWFAWGPVFFQPTEVAKLVMVLVLAVFLNRHWQGHRQAPALGGAVLLVVGHVGLILLQPDVSGCLVYLPILLTLWFCAGAERGPLVGVLVYGGVTLGVPLAATWLGEAWAGESLSPGRVFWLKALQGREGWPSVMVWSGVCGVVLIGWRFLRHWGVRIPGLSVLGLCGVLVAGGSSAMLVQRVLKDYQRKRLAVFVNPERDPLGAGYNVFQSKVAVGSGQWVGRGYLRGTQSRLGFLPAPHTDFIFAVLAEELGFWGAIGVLALIAGVLWRVYRIAVEARDRLGTLVACGLLGMFSFYFLFNVGMVLGLFPVTGLPLPFVSYGGSSLVASWWAVGLLESIHLRRFVY